MAELLKDRFTRQLLEHFADGVQEAYPAFDRAAFLAAVFDDEWAGKELKQRFRAITLALGKTLPADYPAAIEVLEAITDRFRGFEYLFFPDFVMVYGLDDWDTSMRALERFTMASSSEEAVRPFIKRDPERMMAQMLAWAEHPNDHVRRLASEGCRPRLPWMMALEDFKRDPSPILPILERLKDDESEYVRRSVANNLNDITKDHPALVIELAHRWYGASERTDAVLKHACRTLLKRGIPEVLALFGFSQETAVTVSGFRLESDVVPIGGELAFAWELQQDADEPVLVRIDYAIDYVKSNGKTSRKVFKLSERSMPPGSVSYSRRQSMRDMTTRKHYPGMHRVTLIVNGRAAGSAAFELKLPEVQG
jgi:3-methyladenine DNA glycosylase AlkC